MLGGLKPIELLETPIIIGQSAAKLIIYYIIRTFNDYLGREYTQASGSGRLLFKEDEDIVSTSMET